MQFSLKWLLASVAYAAIACTSLIHANDVWIDIATLLVFATCIVAAIGTCLCRGAVQAAMIGFLVASVLARVGIFSDFDSTKAVRRSVDRCSDRLEAVVPTRRSVIRDFVLQEYEPTESLGTEMDVGVHPQGVVVKFGVSRPAGIGLVDSSKGTPYVVPTSVYRAVPLEHEVAAVFQQHLLLVASTLGALLGRWFFHRRGEGLSGKSVALES